MNRESSPRSRPVLNKRDMYDRIVRGEFGNTIPRYFTIREWEASDDYRRYDLWGVQSTTVAGDPRARLNVPRDGVRRYAEECGLARDGVCVSMMVTAAGPAVWEGDVCRRWDGPGLLCSGTYRPEPGTWRTHMKTPRLWQGSAANVLLRHVLNENSHDDLMELLDAFPDHVVEFTALPGCLGTCPGRNAVVWECRRY